MITTIIVDDLKSCIDSLQNNLKCYPDINVVATATTVVKAKEAILRHQPTLLFLDVEMPNQSGLALLREISTHIHPNMCVVFYSAFSKYMIEAMRASAFDFLLKPYIPVELDLIIHRVKRKINSGQANFDPAKYNILFSEKKFALHTHLGEVLFLSRPEVLYFEYIPEDKYWYVKLSNFTEHNLKSTTKSKEILEMSESFVQVSQNHIVNMDYLSSINRDLHCSFNPPFQNIKIKASRGYYSLLKKKMDFL